MKTLLLLLALTLSAAAADTLEVTPQQVALNGKNVGNVCSFVATNPQYASAVQAALEQWAATVQKTAADSTQAATAAQASAEAKLAELVSGAKAALALKTSAQRMEAASKLLDQVTASDRQRERQKKREELAKLQAELDALDAK